MSDNQFNNKDTVSGTDQSEGLSKILLLGNEAIAWGAIEAGVEVAAAYPGTPSSEIMEVLAREQSRYGFYAEWSVNEKAALEVAAGASYCGARAIAAMKQVGLNVAADPLMTLSYIGCKGGLVIVVADDPGPHSSQTEQDTRRFARFAQLPVLDPGSPAEARAMTKYAFDLSESIGKPVILRPTTRVCHVSQDIVLDDESLSKRMADASAGIKKEHSFQRGNEWIIFPQLAYRKHQQLAALQKELTDRFDKCGFNSIIDFQLSDQGNNAPVALGLIASGVSYEYLREVLELLRHNDRDSDRSSSYQYMPSAVRLMKIGTPGQLPAKKIAECFLPGLTHILVIEEQDPVVEEQLIRLMWKKHIDAEVKGKEDYFVPRAGEFSPDLIRRIVGHYFAVSLNKEEISKTDHSYNRNDQADRAQPELPVRPPTLCAGCPHRAVFLACKQELGTENAVYHGDIGCYTLGNAPPLSLLDTCLCMGAGLTLAQGMSRADKRIQVAFIGDSTFFHTGIPGVINAVFNHTNVVMIVLDNGTTAMTGCQPNPGLRINARGVNDHPVDIAALIKACGVDCVITADAFDLSEVRAAVRKAAEYNGPAVIVTKSKCVQINKQKKAMFLDRTKCLNCGRCLKELGCPAITLQDDLPQITSQCTGCGVCTQICPAQAITEVTGDGC